MILETALGVIGYAGYARRFFPITLFPKAETSQVTAASNTFAGLIPGLVYQITASAVGTAGPSD